VNPPLCQGTADACEAGTPRRAAPLNNIVYTLLKHFFEGPIQWNFEKVSLPIRVQRGLPLHWQAGLSAGSLLCLVLRGMLLGWTSVRVHFWQAAL